MTLQIGCHECKNPSGGCKTFTTKAKAREHYKKKHGMNLPAGIRGAKAAVKEGDAFRCPSCTATFANLEDQEKHLSIHLSQDEESGASDPELDVIMVQPNIHVQDVQVTSMEQKGRDYNEAIIYPCNIIDRESSQHAQTIKLIDAMELVPFSLIGQAQGIEHSALAHPHVIDNAAGDKYTIRKMMLPKKRRHDDNDDCAHAWTYPRDVQSLLAMSPYTFVLQHRRYIELTAELCDLANFDWRFHEHSKYVVAQLFAGGILFQSDTHEAILMNTIEAYGRGKTLDAHREPSGIVKGVPIHSSLPPPIGCRYKDVWPTIINSKDGKKLVIGTQTCNMLVTSSLRLDNKDQTRSRPCLGASAVNFDLETKSTSMATMIFLDFESVIMAQKLARDVTAVGTSKIAYLHQLRQLNSKFDDASTYFLTRCSGPLTRSIKHQPLTVFTLADHGNTTNAGAALMNMIGTAVLKFGKSAKVDKADVTRLTSMATGEIKVNLTNILKLFGNDEEITVLHNRALADNLANLTKLLHPAIAEANKTVALNIEQTLCSKI
ncbi:hypothetical protein BC940DRAFT_365932 [Gongronella butleri]|nr:hypothetical protein BC940DRAFT_365932 [Gongronella butleri]